MTVRSVLVADDDALVRESLCDLLTDLGCQAWPAADGGQAMRFLGQSPCDLVLSDVDMPDMTGFALLSWMHQHQRVPAVLMSARGDAHLDREAKRAGALAFWTKPVGTATVSSFITNFFTTSHGASAP